MKSKLVLRGENASNEKILIALELIAEENKVKILTFPDAIVTDEFHDLMKKDWRDGKTVELPEGYTEIIKDLTVSEDLLPEDIKVERTDVIERKKLEWAVLVLSSKMHLQFKSELESIKEKVDKLDSFDNAVWENLKGFWAKVQNQIREGILDRNYANDLRKGSDELFDKLKVLRKKVDDEYRVVAKENFDWFSQKLDGVEKKIEEGLKLSGVFDELKELQRKFKDTKLTREFRNKIWSRIDGSFKAAKAKKYGDNATNDNSALSRINNRYEGLMKALKRTEQSKERDVKDLEFENRRIQNTDGQLEAQIRQAKIKMIEQRIKFKDEKLEDMYATKKQLDEKMEKMKEREKMDKIRKEKAAAAKAKIKEEVKQTQENLDEEAKLKLEAAAEKINESKKPKPKSMVEKVMDTVEEVKDMVGEKLEDTIDTVKAAAVVVSEEVSEKMEPFTKKGEEVLADLKDKAGDIKESVEDKIEDLTGKSEDAPPVEKEVLSSSEEEDNSDHKNETDMGKDEKGFFDNLADKAKNLAENLEEKFEDVVDSVESKLETEDNKDKSFLGKLADKANELKDVVEDKVEGVVDAVESKLETEDNKDKSFFGKLADKAGEMKDAAEEKFDDLVDGAKKDKDSKDV